jgi:hypothetical protein
MLYFAETSHHTLCDAKVNRLLYYRLNHLWDQGWLAELFEKVRTNFAAFESGKNTEEEIEQEIELDDELLKEVLDEEVHEARATGQNERQVHHNACSVCQQEEAPSANPIFLCACCSRRFHRLCHTPPAVLEKDPSVWVCGDCGSGARDVEDED